MPTAGRRCSICTCTCWEAGAWGGRPAVRSARAPRLELVLDMTSTSGGAPGTSELQGRIQSDLNSARKAQNKNAVLLLGTILADIKNRRIEEKRELTDAEGNEVLRKGIKKRRESIEMYDKASRADLADRERAEVTALEAYLPANVSDEEIRAAIRKVIAEGATTI